MIAAAGGPVNGPREPDIPGQKHLLTPSGSQITLSLGASEVRNICDSFVWHRRTVVRSMGGLIAICQFVDGLSKEQLH
jgi:hypothetical protein